MTSKTYSLTWYENQRTYKVVGTGLSILTLYDRLIKSFESKADHDLIVIYGPWQTIMSREKLVEETS
jgi:hypothetical protein